MGMDIRYGLMAPSTRVSGSLTRPMALANWCMQMVTSMKDSGEMTKHTDMDPILMQTVPHTWESGSTTSSTARVWKLGQIMPNMMDNTLKERSMGVEL